MLELRPIFELDDERHSVSLLKRLTKQFGNENIVLMNFHDTSLGGPGEKLFCQAMTNASHTCDAIRAKAPAHANAAKELSYLELSYGAKEAGLVQIETDAQMDKIAKAVQNYQEKNSLTFGKICLPTNVRDALLAKSLEYERALFPETYDKMEESLRSDFAIAAQTKLCRLDIEKTLADEKWRAFFQSL